MFSPSAGQSYVPLAPSAHQSVPSICTSALKLSQVRFSRGVLWSLVEQAFEFSVQAYCASISLGTGAPALNVAPTDLAALIVTAHPPVPVQAPAQPPNELSADGVA
jgi:hypothetical protein